ncbi:MAG TPA: hypothetical protein VHG91_13840 [Longimicrobium sp.]|nr:hypothetical protein [Longimicrobium sp.]
MPADRAEVPARFQDGGLTLWHLADEFLVRCPRCGRMARVLRLGEPGKREVRAHCTACAFALHAPMDRAPWFGPVRTQARGRCGRCGTRLERAGVHPEGSPPPRVARVRCPTCGRTNHFAVTWTKVPRCAEPHDGLVGLPLWLQTPVRGETLWAFNRRHLDALEAYVGATLRERRPVFNGSFASRLPRFVTRAEHRDAVLHAIARLRATLPAERGA